MSDEQHKTMPRETLIAALDKISNHQTPSDLDNILRALHNGYAETTEFITRNARRQVCLRAYGLSITDAGASLLEVAHE